MRQVSERKIIREMDAEDLVRAAIQYQTGSVIACTLPQRMHNKMMLEETKKQYSQITGQQIQL